ncbi:internal virion protein B-like protein [uncultured Mediterranean phage uvMED]|uniref:Internal virion protein n=1 Tax=uncultured organism MedDCM-OCT-S09-C787 TaxID=743652 RepID=D6PL50_9ZZZZ|nr:hypothetical protein [uncultured organism MedDCM-OCT-S09-C787]BAQ85573.1 internal virion protein B-like protein [uncultured Mediterranean phage uvMED]
MGWVSAITAGQAAAVSVGTSIIGARQASANGKFNQSVSNRNALIKEQEAEAIEAKKELDLAKFDKQFQVLEGEVITRISTSGAELSGSGMRVMRYNAEQAELEKDMIAYNAEINKSRKFEEANFARIQGDIARQNARMTELSYYSKAGESLLKTYG